MHFIYAESRELRFAAAKLRYEKNLEELGHSVAFLDIERNEADDQLLGTIRSNRSVFDFCSSKIFAKLKKLDRYTRNRLKNRWRNKQQAHKMEQFRQTALDIEDSANYERYDCCVIGSDEVFNCMSSAKWGFTSQLFGDVRQADRVITYAASSGATVLEELPEAVAGRIKEAFAKVSAFSVRDRNTRRMVSALTEKPVEEHLDPVLVGDFYEEICGSDLPEGLPEKYCVIYSYYNRIHKPEEIRAIQSFCEKHDMQIVTAGAPQMWVKQHLVLEPFEVLRLFQNAEFVVTDTFHGTIFSAKYTRRFATMTRASNENKLSDLIERLGIQSHRVTSFAQLETAYTQEHDPNRIADICAAERERTIRYLKENL